MKPTLLALSLTGLALPLLVGCANQSHASDAEDLRQELAGLPGVEKVTLDYTEPITLDSGKLQLKVSMAADADADATTDVVTTTYSAFAGVHEGEEGDLDVSVGDDVIHLRSFEPDAGTDAVEQAATAAVSVLRSGAVRADINTQDVSKDPHVFTLYTVTVDEPGAEGLVRRLGELEQQYADLPDAGWSVESQDGWQIAAGRGFPDEDELALFAQLRRALPQGSTMTFNDDDFAAVQLPPTTTPAQASAMAGRQLPLIGGAATAFYTVESGETLIAFYAAGDCTFDTGPVGARLEQDHQDGCTDVDHPDDPA